MDYQQITVDLADSVLTVTLNRPDKLNAWTQRMESEFRHAMETAAADERVRAIVVTGAGRGFCAGADMSILEAGAAGDVSADEIRRPRRRASRPGWTPTTVTASATCCACRSRSSRRSTGRWPASACA